MSADPAATAATGNGGTQTAASQTAAPQHAAPVLELSSIVAGYGRTTVLHGIDLSVPPGTVVALVGANGAGKTTIMRVAAGLLRPTSGTVRLDGVDVTRLPAEQRARRGICLIPEGRGIFRGLTVKENLRLSVPPWARSTGLDRALSAFPVLGRRLGQTAGTLSGGEQQMLAVVRAYLSDPKVILCDELSIGLAPVVLDQIFESIQVLVGEGISVVIVEQYVHRVLGMADLASILVRGEMAWRGPAAAVDERLLVESYLT